MESKYVEMADLFMKANDPMFRQYFALDSEKMLDKKIEVLKALIAGEAPKDILNYYKVLELLPDYEQHWDI